MIPSAEGENHMIIARKGNPIVCSQRHINGQIEKARSVKARLASRKFRFARDSPLEGDGFEPSVPLYILTVSDPLLSAP